MSIKSDSLVALAATAILMSLVSLPAQADDSNTASGEQPVLHLGKLSITDQQQIVDTLLAIKRALHEPRSDDPANAAKVVCRIDKGTDTAHEYLDCATNKVYTVHHEALQSAMLVASTGLPIYNYDDPTQQEFDGLIAQQPDQRLHVPVNGGALLALLNSLPDDAKVVPQDDSGQ
jgi:hypothetical protein